MRVVAVVVALALARAVAVPLATAVMLAGLLLLQALMPRRRRQWADTYRRHWGAVTSALLGLRLEVAGQLPPGPALYVANHRSWADAPVLLAVLRCTLLSKAEVADYPIVGVGARAVGIAFVERGRLRSRGAALAGLRATLASGRSIGLFAEGTTSGWGQLRPLEGGAFGLAAEGGHALVPVALSYERPSDAWGDEGLAAHFMRTMGRWRQRVRVVIGPPLASADAAGLRGAATAWLRQTLDRLEPPTEPTTERMEAQPAESQAASR